MTAVTADAPRRYRPATFGDVLRSEWTKFRTVRSSPITLGIGLVLGIGISALVSLAAGDHYAQASLSDKRTWDPTSISMSGLGLAQLAFAILGIMVVTSEYSSGMIRTSLAAVPRRGWLLAAKLLTYLGVILVVGMVTAFVSFSIGQAIIHGHAPSTSLSHAEVLRAVFGAGLYLLVLSAFGVALGALMRHAAAGIAILVAIIFVLPGVAHALPSSWEHAVEKYWPTQAGSQITNVVRGAHTLAPWWGFADFVVFVAIILAAAFWLLAVRDS